MAAVAYSLAVRAEKRMQQFRHVLLSVVNALAEARMQQAQAAIDRFCRTNNRSEDQEHRSVN